MFSLENRRLQRSQFVNFIIKLLHKTNISNKLLAFMVKAFHFTFPWYLFFFCFVSGNYYFCLYNYIFLIFFILLYIYFNGCFVTHLEYKLYNKKFINIVDPYLSFFNLPFNKENRFYGTLAVANYYFLVVSIIIYYRFFFKKN